MAGFDPARTRAEFPILEQQVNGRPLVYLDNGATTQKPRAVIEAIDHYYRFDNANVHRAAHALSERATRAFEAARERVASFIGSPSAIQLVWTRGTTESINLVAASWGTANVRSGDRILVSQMEHHSNIVPWQLLAERTGAEVVPVPVMDDGRLEIDAYRVLLDERVRLVALCHVSNALGTVNPVRELTRMAHGVGATVLVDGAQAPAHLPVDVQALECDFYAFSAHKLFGPTGIGALWGRAELLDAMQPYQGGGEMIERVSFDGTTYNGVPHRFEAGTPHIAGAIGFGAAIEFLQSLDHEGASAHESDLFGYACERAAAFDGLRRVGSAPGAIAILGFVIDGTHPADIGMLLDQQGVAVRTGHHCTQPLMQRFGVPGTVRASFALYNTRDDVDRLFAALESAVRMLK